MTISDPRLEEGLRQGFKRMNPYMVLLFRLGLHPWFNVAPRYSGRVMVITHIGRKSGLKRYSPVNYAIVDGEVYCTAGFGQKSDWYRNILLQPQVEVWLPEGWWAGCAEDISESPQRLDLLREVLIGSGVVAPLFRVHPRSMSDADLDRVTASYRLIHIRRLEARTGAGGPGELSWVWIALTFALAVLLMAKGSKKKGG